MINQFNSIELFITKRCNLNCEYCFVPKLSNEDMPIELAKKIIDKVETNLCIDFFGGEPTLRLDFMKEVMDYASVKPIGFKVFTNGLIYNDDFKYLIKNYSLIPRTSFDGLIENNKQRTNKNQSEKILNNLLEMNQDFPDLIINIVINPYNYQSMLENIKFLNDNGFRYINTIFDRGANWRSVNMASYERVFSELISWYVENLDKVHLVTLEEIFFRLSFKTRFQDNINTSYMKKVSTIDYNGDIYPGELLINEKDCVLGNIFDNTFDVDKARNIYQKIALPQCQDCILQTKCWFCNREFYTCGRAYENIYYNACLLYKTMYEVLMPQFSLHRNKIKVRLDSYKKIRGYQE